MGIRSIVRLAAAVVIAAAASLAVADETGHAKRCVIEDPGVRVCYREVPSSADQIGAKPGPTTGGAKPWLVATIDVRQPLSIGATDLEPGCYAWICTVDEGGLPVLDLRRLPLPKGALPDPEDVLVPSGETLFRMPLQFDTSRGTTPHLTIELSPGREGLGLRVRYGDGEASTALRAR